MWQKSAVRENRESTQAPPAPNRRVDMTRQGQDAADRELMRRIVLQDRSAFEDLYHQYAPRLGAYLSRVLRQQDLAEECFDDVMVVVWQKADRFQMDKRVSTWLFGIAHNKARAALSKRWRQPDRPDERATEDQGGILPDEADFEEQLMQRDQLKVLCRAIEALPPEHRSVLELTFSEGFSYTEIAEVAQVPVNTIKTRMFHARKKLRQALPGILSD